jgi:micrococcal nuclease
MRQKYRLLILAVSFATAALAAFIVFYQPSEARVSRLRYSSPQKVADIINGKSFTLADGTIVRLASLQVPNREETTGLRRAGEPMGEESHQFLKQMIQGKEVQLRPEPALLDRKGRRVAQAKLLDGKPVQLAMLEAGMAVVYPFADNREFLPEMLAAEESARKQQRGIWAHPYWQPVPAEILACPEKERYQLVSGKVQKVASAGGNWYLNFGNDYKTDFTGFIQKADYSRYFKAEDLRTLEGQQVLIRGWIYCRDGAMIDIVLPEQVDRLI